MHLGMPTLKHRPINVFQLLYQKIIIFLWVDEEKSPVFDFLAVFVFLPAHPPILDIF
jgi:hypothetical protein